MRILRNHLRLAAAIVALALATPDSYGRGASGGGFSGGHSSSSSSHSSSSSSSHSSSSSSGSSRSSGSAGSGSSGFGGGSRSWGSTSSSGTSSGGSASRSTPTRATTSDSPWGSTTTTSRASQTATDRALASKVNQSGDTRSRGATVSSDIAQAQSVPKVTTTTTPRANAVPEGVATESGRYAPVYRDPATNQSGFWDDMGRWIVIDSLLNSHRQGQYYYRDQVPASSWGNGNTTQSNGGSSFWWILFGIVLFAGLIIAGIYFMQRMGEGVPSQPRDPIGAASSRFDMQPPPARTPAPPRIKQDQIAYWNAIAPGSFITLTDKQSLEDSQKAGNGLNGMKYTVERVSMAKDKSGFGQWVFLTLDEPKQPLLLMVKAVDNEIDYRIYYASEDFKRASRDAVIARGDKWLFEPPATENNFEPGDLKYAAEIEFAIGDTKTTYGRNDQGERHATLRENPPRSGMTNLLATIVEYSTDDQADNPNLLITEIGGATRKTGEVTLYLGCPIRTSEINII